MRKLSILSGAALVAMAVASPSMALAACALYDPGCATYPMPKKDDTAKRTNVRTEATVQQPVRSAPRVSRIESRTNVRQARATIREDVGGPVRAAGAVAAGAVGTAAAVATAPFRAADSYAYYNEGYNGWDRRSYAERNGFVCTPGELFKGFDGRLHVCQ